MSSESNETTNTVHDAADSNIVQTGSVGRLWVGTDKRTVLLLAITLVVVVVAAAVIAWLVRKPSPPHPLAVDTSVGQFCGSGWVAPNPGPPPLPYEERPKDLPLASGGHVIATVQGMSEPAVVLHSLRAEVISRKPAAGGVLLPRYCATNVVPKFFFVDLSAATPAAVPVSGEHNGQQAGPQDFPLKVDPTDVEQLIVRAESAAEDVEWVLWLRWTSGAKAGEFRVDDGGKPFRTAATTGIPQWFACPVASRLEWRPACG